MYSHTPFLLSIILCTYAVAHDFADRQHSAIQWASCKQNASVPVTCGTLAVPLDYSEPLSQKTLNLELVRLRAVKQPKKGSILLNPGGPGLSGRDLLVGPLAEALRIATGGAYDLIGFDTRYVSS